MYDSSFHTRTLQREIQNRDFKTEPELVDQEYMKSVLAQAMGTASQGFVKLELKQSLLRLKPVFQVVNLPDKLILRKIGRNLGRLTGVRQSNRDTIIKSLREILREGVNYRVYKIDIKDFYESVSIPDLLEALNADPAFSRDSLRVLRSFFTQTQVFGVRGLPRGIALSAILSEYVMRGFDRTATRHPSTYFYSRFVDDIIQGVQPEALHGGKETVPVEIINIVLALSHLEQDQLVEPAYVEKLFAVDQAEYFSIISSLFYIKNGPKYAQTKRRIEDRIKALVSEDHDISIEAHIAHLMIDLLCCPFISLQLRIEILGKVRIGLKLSTLTKDQSMDLLKEMEGRPWFVQWGGVSLRNMIEKKELSAVY